MSVKGKSLRSIKRVLKDARGEKRVRFAYDITNERSSSLELIGFPPKIEYGQHLMPTSVGKATEFNSQGKEIIRKDLPKETITHHVYTTWQDWHGYSHSGFRARDYERYPREFMPAPSESLYALEISGSPHITTRKIDLENDGEKDVLHLANMMLECFGEFQILNSETGVAAGVTLKRVQWKILPKGNYPWKKAGPILNKFTQNLSNSDQKVVERRVETITKYNPDFLAIGQGGFTGYFVYGFEDKAVYILESLYLGNATYVFGDDWKRLSKLTKSQIINGDISHTRIIHDRNWFYKIRGVLAQ